MLSEQLTVRGEEQHRTVQGAECALDHTDHHVTAVCCRSFTEPLRLWAGHLDSRVEVQAKLFASRRVAGTNDETVIESLRLAGNERFGEKDDFLASGGALADQAKPLVKAGMSI